MCYSRTHTHACSLARVLAHAVSLTCMHARTHACAHACRLARMCTHMQARTHAPTRTRMHALIRTRMHALISSLRTVGKMLALDPLCGGKKTCLFLKKNYSMGRWIDWPTLNKNLSHALRSSSRFCFPVWGKAIETERKKIIFELIQFFSCFILPFLCLFLFQFWTLKPKTTMHSFLRYWFIWLTSRNKDVRSEIWEWK